jgi:hypothetical protein
MCFNSKNYVGDKFNNVKNIIGNLEVAMFA